jgi:adenosine deaminase
LLYNPRRIGHGFRAAEDAKLVEVLSRRGIALELCPTSNVRTGIVPNLASHPLLALRNSGVPLTLNTDDPTMFNTTMNGEYLVAATSFGFTPEELAEISMTAIDHSLLESTSKARLRSEFETKFASLGVTPALA